MKEIIAFANFFFHWVVGIILILCMGMYLSCAAYFLLIPSECGVYCGVVGALLSFYMAGVSESWCEYYIDMCRYQSVQRTFGVEKL